MGMELLDLMFRLERRFGVKLSREQLGKLFHKSDPIDLKAGDLYEYLLGHVGHAGVLDVNVDGDDLWLIFRREISNATGVDEEEITKDTFLLADLDMN